MLSGSIGRHVEAGYPCTACGGLPCHPHLQRVAPHIDQLEDGVEEGLPPSQGHLEAAQAQAYTPVHPASAGVLAQQGGLRGVCKWAELRWSYAYDQLGHWGTWGATYGRGWVSDEQGRG